MNKNLLRLLLSGAAAVTAMTAVITVSAAEGTALTDAEHDLTGSSYYLNDDLEITSQININGDVTVDLNGNMLYYDGNYAFSVKSGTLTIIDSSNSDGFVMSNFAGVLAADGCTVNIEGGSIYGGSYGIYAKSGSVAAVSGGVLKGESAGISNMGAAVTISGGEIAGNSYGIYQEAGTTEMTGGAVNGSFAGIGVLGSKVTVSGGAVSGTPLGVYLKGETAELTVTDDAVISGSEVGILSPQGTTTINGGKVTGGNQGYMNQHIKGDWSYLTINGGNITETNTSAGWFDDNAAITSDGGLILTVNGGSIEGEAKSMYFSARGLAEGSAEDNYEGSVQPRDFDIVINDGTVTNLIQLAASNGGAMHSTIKINGGEFTDTDKNIDASCMEKLEITGGTFAGDVDPSLDSHIDIVKNIIVSGGTFAKNTTGTETDGGKTITHRILDYVADGYVYSKDGSVYVVNEMKKLANTTEGTYVTGVDAGTGDYDQITVDAKTVSSETPMTVSISDSTGNSITKDFDFGNTTVNGDCILRYIVEGIPEDVTVTVTIN